MQRLINNAYKHHQILNNQLAHSSHLDYKTELGPTVITSALSLIVRFQVVFFFDQFVTLPQGNRFVIIRSNYELSNNRNGQKVQFCTYRK